jgi:chromosome segregation ATPase
MDDYEELKQQIVRLEARLDSMDSKIEAIEKRLDITRNDVIFASQKFAGRTESYRDLGEGLMRANDRISMILRLAPEIEQAIKEAKNKPQPTAWQRFQNNYGHYIVLVLTGASIASIFILGVLR